MRNSNDPLPADGAAIHLVFEALYRRPRIVPGEPGARRPASDDFLGQKRVNVMQGVHLRRRGIGPAEAELDEATLQFAQHVARFLAHRVGTGLAVTNGALLVARAALPRL